jgi:DNA polymerase V
VYSIDEAFVEIEAPEDFDFEAFGKKIRAEVFRQVGMPVGVGISRTKVLAKVANKLSKKSHGVRVLKTEAEIDGALKDYPVRDIWGIGVRSASKLSMIDVKTALDLKNYKDDKMIQKLLTKVGREIQDELRGINCLSIEGPEDKKNTGNSRSFGYDVTDKRELREALAQFCTNATWKLRNQGSVCYGVSAYIHTNPFKPGAQYFGEGSVRFSSGTSDVIKIIRAAHSILDEIYRPGFGYKKGGILLNHIVPANQSQLDLFTDPSDNETLNRTMDLINKKYGPHTIKSGACGTDQAWKTIFDYKSKHYTTDFDDFLEIEL